MFIVELSIGAAADADGNYSISGLAAGAYTVRVSFIGFKTNEQAYSVSSGASRLNVVLEPDYTGLEEVDEAMPVTTTSSRPV